jgi:PAS domain S-box-containing protein
MPEQTYAVRNHTLLEAEKIIQEISCCAEEWAALSQAVKVADGPAGYDASYRALYDAVYAYADGKYQVIVATIGDNEYLPYYAIAATSVVVLIAFFFVLKVILDPVSRLTESVEAVGLGDEYSFPQRIFYPREIVLLGSTFQRLISQLRHELSGREVALREIQMKAQREAEAKASHLSNIISGSASPIFMLDLAGNITSWNGRMAALTSLHESHAIDRNFALDFLWGSDKSVFQSETEKIKSGTSSGPIQLKVQGRCDQPITMLVTITAVLDAEGEPSGFTCMGQEVDDFFKDATQRLERQQANQFSMLAASAAHQVSQPLQKIRLYLANAKNRVRMKNFEPEGIKEKLDGADFQLNRVASIIDQLRDLGRVADPVSGGFELRQVLDRCIELTSPVYKEVGISVQSDIQLTDQRVNGHPLSLEKTVLACLTNAKDAIDRRGISQGEITIRARITDKRDIKITIEDNGVGIEPAVLGRVFDPFFSTYTDDRHLGLGLATSRAYLEETGGIIRIESDGDGTVVTLFYSSTALALVDHSSGSSDVREGLD